MYVYVVPPQDSGQQSKTEMKENFPFWLEK